MDWNKIFWEIYFKEQKVGYLPDSMCHKTIRKSLQSCLDKCNKELKEIGEQVEVDKVKVAKIKDRGGVWKITFVSTSLNLL